MAKAISLKQRLESMDIGAVTVTDLSRNGVYVAAKRAGVKVSTMELPDGTIEIGIVSKIAKPFPTIPKTKAPIEIIRELSATDRLAIFAQFELCCGMNLGECVCEPDEPQSYGVRLDDVITPEQSKDEKLAALRSLIGGTSKAIVELVEEDWRFTKDAPHFADDGNVYRRQVLAPDGKRFRSVQVDEGNYELVIKVF